MSKVDMNIHTAYGDYLYLGSHMKCPKHGWIETKKKNVCPQCLEVRDNEKIRKPTIRES